MTRADCSCRVQGQAKGVLSYLRLSGGPGSGALHRARIAVSPLTGYGSLTPSLRYGEFTVGSPSRWCGPDGFR
jgi:hypothetical protein